MASWEDYKGMQVPDAPTGDAGINLKDNFDELADRAGPVHEAAADPTADDDQNDTGGNGSFYVWSKWRNTSNNKIFVCVDPSTGAAVWIDVTDSTGDVTGPASSTDNAIARFDGTGGKTLQNSDVVVADDNSIERSTSGEAVTVKSNIASGSALHVQGSASQSANLQEWRNSGGTKLSAVGPDGEFNFGPATQLTISSGAVTATKSYHTVETEGGGATDDLDTINGGIEGDVLAIRPANAAHTVVAKNGTGNLKLNGDYTMDDAEDTLTLLFDGANWLELARSVTSGGGGTASLPRGFIDGLILANNSSDADHDIDISAGTCRDSGDDYDLSLTSTLTKQIDASWAAGNNAGGLFSGTVAADTWYHVFLIRKDSDGSIDAGFDTSVSAANIPSGYAAYRRIGSVLSDASSNIYGFSQVGGLFTWEEIKFDFASDVSSTATLATLSVAPDVNAIAWLYVYLQLNDDDHLLITSPNASDQPCETGWNDYPAAHAKATRAQTQVMQVLTNTSGQVRLRSEGNQSTGLYTTGWYDFRGH